MSWTTDYPTKPGFYWIRNYRHYAQGHDGPELVQLIQETVTFAGRELRFYFFGDDMLYRLDSIGSAEWQGPIEPEREKNNRPEFKWAFPGMVCRDCDKPSNEFISWQVATVNNGPVFGIICRECWIKRLTPEQRKVYMV